MSVEQKRVKITIKQLDQYHKPVKGTSRSILVKDTPNTDEIQNIILNAFTRYGIKHSYTWTTIFQEVKQ